MGTAADPAPVRDLGDYTRPLRRRWKWVALGVALGLALGIAATAIKHHTYTSTASVVVTPTLPQQDVNNANGRTQDVINLDTEAQIVKSDAVAARVRRTLHAHATLAAIESRIAVLVPPNTTVLRISYTAGSPGHAKAGADAAANAYLAVRASMASHILKSQEAAVRNQMTSIANALKAQANQSGSSTGSTTGGQGSARALHYKALAAESSALAKQLSALVTTVVTPGNVISSASTPTGGAKKTALLFVLSGLMIGLLLGAGAAIARDRTDSTLRERRQLEDAGVSVVGNVGSSSDSARTYRRLAHAIVGTASGGAVVVADPGWGPRSNDVALNLAAAIRDLAHRVALVRVANGTAEMTRLSMSAEDGQSDGAAQSPEISAPLAAATRATLRQGVERLKQDSDFVVIDAADSLAEAVVPVCETGLLLVSINTTRIDDVLDAANEMEQAGVHVLGAMVLDPPDSAKGRRARLASGLWDAEPSDPQGPPATPGPRDARPAATTRPRSSQTGIRRSTPRYTGSSPVGNDLQAGSERPTPTQAQELLREPEQTSNSVAEQPTSLQAKQAKPPKKA